MDDQAEKPGTRRSGLMLAIVAAALVLYQALAIFRYVTTDQADGDPLFADFYAFWSFGRFLHAHPAAQIYDFKLLESVQHALLPGFQKFYPCIYPPMLLLFLGPLGLLGYMPAFAVWTALGLIGFALAVGATERGARLPWLAVLAPTTILTIIFGQNGLITAALLIGGFRVMERRPWLAGVLLGLLSCKPQIFVLVPLVLLVGRRWRPLAATVLMVAALAVTSVLVFGLGAWLAWLKALPGFSRALERDWDKLGWLMPTVTASLRSAGLSAPIFSAMQLLVAAVVVAVLLALFHRSRSKPAPTALDAATLQVGLFLTTPYAFIYDMPIVSAAAVTLAIARMGPGQSWQPGERVTALAAYSLPLIIFSEAFKAIPLGPVVLAAMFAMLARAAWDVRASDAP
uniref:glycosyltransferase family 87 protein n=1 Tax=uncultured Caulobacter sp. TaxID=158749 RepID=UPI0025D93616|nr:glycosyltransferase family 87 protein [uncultured Caulobacter sp.]